MQCRSIIALALVPLLAACGGGGSGSGKVQSAGTRPAATTPRPAARTPARPPARPALRPPQRAQVLVAPGLEGVVGAGPAELARQFGPARLDVWEGDARKLQFVGPACVLDVFLYPAATGREPAATYVEARRTSDGQDVDRAACIAALRKSAG